jgi:hypothetical protein
MPGPWSLPRRPEHQNLRCRRFAAGNPVRLIAWRSQRNDIAFAHQLIEGLPLTSGIAGEGYADHFCNRVAESASQPVISAQNGTARSSGLRCQERHQC